MAAPPDDSGSGAGAPRPNPRVVREIDILDDLSWILEALAQDLPAEAKQVLPHLITVAESCPNLDDEARAELLYRRGRAALPPSRRVPVEPGAVTLTPPPQEIADAILDRVALSLVSIHMSGDTSGPADALAVVAGPHAR